ncbi:UPF0271 protein [Arboricoccus pini]|uniref:UPF0271 protein n=1 Tax=Arboricoccus pini TaxID=1963835 RepID=A0A212RHW3_9PROT|nr:5-oxoprolinase subunit PxpA [Arboricoccus pini]SNB72013.1 UPF0271 protein [Arboricoccus pini]
MTYRPKIDINCDMGEAFGAWRLGLTDDELLMPLITSANVAAGFHGGDPNHLDRSVRLAKANGVGLGAHPGYADLQGFGRRTLKAPAEELVNDIVYQMGAVREFGRRHGVPLQHVKLHGALALDAGADPVLAEAFAATIEAIEPTLFVMGMQVWETVKAAQARGLPVIREFYADRDYGPDGNIVFARKVDRMDPATVGQKVLRACREGLVTTVEGEDIEVAFESICFHSDTPGSLEMAKGIRAALAEGGIEVAPITDVLATI